MSFIYDIISPNMLQALAYTFLHSLWIGAIAALLLMLSLQLLQQKGPSLRYIAALLALGCFLAGNIAVFLAYYQPGISTEQPDFSFGFSTAVSNELSINSPAYKAGVFEKALLFYEQIYPALVALWLLGIILLSLRFTGGIMYNNRIRKKFSSFPGEEIVSLTRKLAARMNIKNKVWILKSSFVQVPAVTGFLKPVILLPVSLLMQIPQNQLEAIIAHELAHIRRSDHLVNLIQCLVEIIFFYHPAVWWIAGIIGKEREEICDDIAVAQCGDKLVYAKALMQLEECRQHNLTAALALTGQKNSLINRLKRLLMKKERKTNYVAGFIAGALIISVVAFLSVKAGEVVNQTEASIYKTALFQYDNDEGLHRPDTVHLKSPGASQSLIMNTDRDGKSIMIQKQDGQITRLEVDGEVIDPEKYDDYEAMIEEMEKEIHIEKEKREILRQERDLKRVEMQQKRRKMEMEREKMHQQRRMTMDSMRKEHRQRAELMRKEMEEARKMHSEHFRMQIEKQAGPEFHEDLFAESKPEERNTEDRIKDEEIQQLKKQVHRQQIFRINQQWNEQLSKQRILNELYEDQLLGPYDDASVYLTGKKLIINGEKQPRKIMKKYRDMYEALSGEEIARDEIIEIQ